ncbi:hypothetical protein CR513_20024, partial [Mucuna pruriens]
MANIYARPRPPQLIKCQTYTKPINYCQKPNTMGTIQTRSNPRPRPTRHIKCRLRIKSYVYLDHNQHSPVIIANNLCREQEEKLLKVLQ